MIRPQPLFEDGKPPLVAEPENASSASPGTLNQWLVAEKDRLDAMLNDTGAVLFRGFGVCSAAGFGKLAETLTGELKAYTGGDSPRHAVEPHVYTSTEFPPEMEITLHNELTYSGWWPSRVAFCCLQPPATGGQTQIADARAVYREIDSEVRDRFETRGVCYIRSYYNKGGVGKTWQESFETDDPNTVDSFCRENGMECEWFDWGVRTRTPGPGVAVHPVNGDSAWINQADQFHAAFNTPWEKEFDADQYDPDALPFHCCFGDGSDIEIADLEEIRRAGRKCEVLFDWQAGDLLVLDNILTQHGRKPYTGDRKILVAMG